MVRFNLVMLIIVLTILTGCDTQRFGQPNTASKPATPSSTTADPVAAARNHVQQYIDRLIGGDLSVKQGLLGIPGVEFESIESIEIISAVPTYLATGEKVGDMVRVNMRVRGYHATQRRIAEQTIDRDVLTKDGKPEILGAGF